MNTLYPDGWYLMQDNDRAHTSKETIKWLKDHGVQVIEWPAFSPDLNCIENLWGLMKRQVEEVDPTEPKRFEGEVMKIWDDITHELLESFIK